MPETYIKKFMVRLMREKVIRNQKWDNSAVDMSDGEK